jgi:hypothetical protein
MSDDTRIRLDSSLTLVNKLGELPAGQSPERTAIVEDLRGQLAVLLFREIEEEHDGCKYVEVSRTGMTDGGGVEIDGQSYRVSTSSSCKCRMMSSDPDENELYAHRDELVFAAMCFVGSLPSGLMADVLADATKIRLYAWPTVRCGTPPFPAEDDIGGFR